MLRSCGELPFLHMQFLGAANGSETLQPPPVTPAGPSKATARNWHLKAAQEALRR